MGFSKAFALAAIFATLTSAAPMQQKRDVVYETVTEVDVTTIDTTITIYPGEATATSVAAAVTTTAVAVTSVPEKVAVSSTSTYVPAPAPQTTSSTTSVSVPTSTVVPVTTYAPPPPAPATSTSTSSSSTSTSSTSTSSAPASTSTGSSILSGSGDGTYYETATSMSAPSYCDTANDGDTTNVVALSYEVMDESLCGATITVEYNGKTSTGTVVDKCMGCDSQSVDMSEHMFEELADLGAGRISVTWSVE